MNESPTTQVTLAPPAETRAVSSASLNPPASAAAMKSFRRILGCGGGIAAAPSELGDKPSGISTKRRFPTSVSCFCCSCSCAAVQRKEKVAAGAAAARARAMWNSFTAWEAKGKAMTTTCGAGAMVYCQCTKD